MYSTEHAAISNFYVPLSLTISIVDLKLPESFALYIIVTFYDSPGEIVIKLGDALKLITSDLI